MTYAKAPSRTTGRAARPGRAAVPRRSRPVRPASYPRRPSRQTGLPSWTGWLVGALAVTAAVAGVFAIQQPERTAFGTIAVLISEDSEVAGNGLDLVREDVTERAASLAETGGGTLVVAKAGGGPAHRVAEAQLAIEGPDGQPEHDRETLTRIAGQRIDAALEAAATSRVEEGGRNLLSLLAMAADLAPSNGQPFHVFLVGFGLGTVDPADARIQLGGDPGQAVDAMRDRLPGLTGATLHLVFPAAAGDQEPLNVATATWRRTFWQDIAVATGATLGSISEENRSGAVTPGAPSAPPIPNLTDPTTVPVVDIPAPAPAGEPQPVPPPVILAGSTFKPDLAEFVDENAATAQLSSLADAWNAYPGSYVSVDCIGRTAAFGPADSAVALSQQRAEAAKRVLTDLGVTVVNAVGKGFGDPLPGVDPTDQLQRSVSCQLVPQP
jgi:outer membrane protein OmpA-like peptidoglycan-associated protein